MDFNYRNEGFTKPSRGRKGKRNNKNKTLDDVQCGPNADGVCGWTMALVENGLPENSKSSSMSFKSHSISHSKSEEKISMNRPCIPRPSSPSEIHLFNPGDPSMYEHRASSNETIDENVLEIPIHSSPGETKKEN